MCATKTHMMGRSGHVPADKTIELLVCLSRVPALRYLYPGPISPSTIWDHLTESKDQYAVDYCNFWRSGAVGRIWSSGRRMPRSRRSSMNWRPEERASVKPALPAASMLAETGSTISELRATTRIDRIQAGTEAGGESKAYPRPTVRQGCALPGAVDGRACQRSGMARAFDDVRPRIGDWLRERPEVQKQIVADYLSTGGVVLTDSKARTPI